VRELIQRKKEHPDPPAAEQLAPVTPEDPGRPIGEILAFLGCPSANYVTLSKLGGGHGPTLELAREMAERNANKWAAEVPGRSMLISRTEYDLLKKAGAEDELPERWGLCE
jgi:hypothetical protein